jgi:transposase
MSEEVNISNADNNNSHEESKESRALKNERRLIEIRRSRVSELWAQGHSQPSIAAELNVSQPTINSDIAFLRQHAREQIKSFVTEQLPSTVAKAKITLDMITQKLWFTVAQAERDGDEKTKLSALAAIQSAEMQKVEIVSNTGIVDSVISAAEGLQQKQQASLVKEDYSSITDSEEEEAETVHPEPDED